MEQLLRVERSLSRERDLRESAKTRTRIHGCTSSITERDPSMRELKLPLKQKFLPSSPRSNASATPTALSLTTR